MTAVTEHSSRFAEEIVAVARPRPMSENPFIVSLRNVKSVARNSVVTSCIGGLSWWGFHKSFA